jgi:hypothetical protein
MAVMTSGIDDIARRVTELGSRIRGKTHDFGGNIGPCFTRPAFRCGYRILPGNVRDLAAARENVLVALRPFLEAMPVLADSGYEGVYVPVKKTAGVSGGRSAAAGPPLHAGPGRTGLRCG